MLSDLFMWFFTFLKHLLFFCSISDLLRNGNRAIPPTPTPWLCIDQWPSYSGVICKSPIAYIKIKKPQKNRTLKEEKNLLTMLSSLYKLILISLLLAGQIRLHNWLKLSGLQTGAKDQTADINILHYTNIVKKIQCEGRFC